MIARVLGFLTVAFVAACLAVPVFADETVKPTEKPFLWVIESETPSFLYGTIHLPDDRVLALPEIVRAAYDASDVVYTEVPMDQATQMKAAEAFMMPGEKTLADVLPQPLYDRVDEVMQSKGLSLAMFGKFKPIAIAVQLVLLDYIQELMTKKPLDGMLYAMAEEQGKGLAALETIEEQIAVFDAFDEAEQVHMLESTMDYLDEAKAAGVSVTNKMIETYVAGDAEKMWETVHEYMNPDDPVDQKFMKVALTERNERMAERIIDKLKADPDKVHFFAVGAGHYHRDDGILVLMKKAGYKVKRLSANDMEKMEKMLPAAAGSAH